MTRIRDAAKGQPCTLKLDGCNGDSETVVLCHSPFAKAGMSLKSDDWDAAFGCSQCHNTLDRRSQSTYTREQLQRCFKRAKRRTHALLYKMGVKGN